MDELRIILLLVGIGVVGLVYWHSRRQARRRESQPDVKLEPVFDESDVSNDDDTASLPELEADEPVMAVRGDDEFDDDIAVGETRDFVDDSEENAETAEQPQIEQKIITLRLVARGDDHFNGEQVVLALRGLGLRHGKFGIFHRVEGTDDESIVFSVASLVEPGTFDLANIREQQLPGVSMFMVLPGPKDGAEAFDEMMETARALADSLNGELLDEAGSTMSVQRERFLREEIIQYQHGLAVS
ncbi:cell division protein ZipA [Lentisalinibacter sediminis]|uniref:cell division protein ZipA n=1 Tax=Lentisalinibacter sediminis TaxID=2992237 RepID=UPI003865F254